MERAFSLAMEKLDGLRQNRKVVAAYVFGSYLKSPKKARDIDICIVGSLSKNDMAKMALEFDKPVDISFMAAMPYYVAVRVLREGRQIFLNDEAEMAKAWQGVVRSQLQYGAMRQRVYQGVERWMNSKTA